MPPAPIFSSSVYWPSFFARSASVRRPKIIREPIVAMAVTTAHHATMLMPSTGPSAITKVATASGAIASADKISVRRGVLGIVLARASTTLAHARTPLNRFMPLSKLSPNLDVSDTAINENSVQPASSVATSIPRSTRIVRTPCRVSSQATPNAVDASK